MAVVQGSICSSYLIEIEKTKNIRPPHGANFRFIWYNRNPKKPRSSNYSFTALSSLQREAQTLVQQFNPQIPIEEALTPPSSWYADPDFYSRELERVFYRGWQAVGYTEQIKQPLQYFTGRLGNVEYVVCRDDSGNIHAFHNVCRHHASLLASGSGQKSCFACPYHGWTYGLDGRLLKATRITGIKNFKVNEMGLVPLRVGIWGPFILLNFDKGSLLQQESQSNAVGEEWLGSASEILSSRIIDSSLSFLCRREYTIECNWKVFCDNYLDGGYHVPYAHKGLASGLKLESYSNTVHEKVSIQICGGDSMKSEQDFDRLGSEAQYAFVYPNFMINRYGPWMDTNLAVPLGPRKCRVIFDYFLDTSLKVELILIYCLSQNLFNLGIWNNLYHMDDNDFIEKSLKDSEKVQEEDITLCEAVQRGIESPAYCCGRYAPAVETPMYHFHSLLYENLSN